jgi:hypothetical protein
MVSKPRPLGQARPKHGAGMIARPKHLGLARFFFFFNNTTEVHKELLVRCPETIQHIYTSIKVLNKNITFT